MHQSKYFEMACPVYHWYMAIFLYHYFILCTSQYFSHIWSEFSEQRWAFPDPIIKCSTPWNLKTRLECLSNRHIEQHLKHTLISILMSSHLEVSQHGTTVKNWCPKHPSELNDIKSFISFTMFHFSSPLGVCVPFIYNSEYIIMYLFVHNSFY